MQYGEHSTAKKSTYTRSLELWQNNEKHVSDEEEEGNKKRIDVNDSTSKKKKDAAKQALEKQERAKSQAAYEKRMFDRVSFHGLPLTAAIQISGTAAWGGITRSGSPPGWLESDNPWLYREIGEASDMAVNGEDVSGDINKNESALVFALAKTAGYTFTRGHHHPSRQ